VDINLIFRIAAVGILVAVLNIILKQSQREDIAMLTTLAGLVVVLLMVLDLLRQLFQNVRMIFDLF